MRKETMTVRPQDLPAVLARKIHEICAEGLAEGLEYPCTVTIENQEGAFALQFNSIVTRHRRPGDSDRTFIGQVMQLMAEDDHFLWIPEKPIERAAEHPFFACPLLPVTITLYSGRDGSEIARLTLEELGNAPREK